MRPELSLHQLYVCNRIVHALEDHVIFFLFFFICGLKTFYDLVCQEKDDLVIGVWMMLMNLVGMMVLGIADSTVLAHVLTELNKRHNYGLDLFLLSIDEGIAGYRDDSLETVKRNEVQVLIHLFSFSLGFLL